MLLGTLRVPIPRIRLTVDGVRRLLSIDCLVLHHSLLDGGLPLGCSKT